jgi:predicted HD superfamily hydrolase involved in NAD metabolism
MQMHKLFKQLIRDVSMTGHTPSDVTALLTHHGHANTLRHCQRVAAKAVELAALFGADPGHAQTASLLHDVSALFPIKQRISAAKELGIEVLPEEETAPMLLHQKLSAAMAHGIFGIRDETILSAIECHTTLKAKTSILDKVVFVADKVAWDQPGIPPYLQDLTQALEHSLDKAAFCYLEYLWQKRETLAAIHPWFAQAYHALHAQYEKTE